MANFADFLRTNDVAKARLTASGNGINFVNANGIQVATLILNDETPAEEDILAYLKARKDYTCAVRGNFMTLTKQGGVSLAGLFEDEVPAKSRKKVKA